MSDFLQIIVVTTIAGAAMVALVLPYVRRESKAGASCGKCASGNPCGQQATVQPLNLIRTGQHH